MIGSIFWGMQEKMKVHVAVCIQYNAKVVERDTKQERTRGKGDT